MGQRDVGGTRAPSDRVFDVAVWEPALTKYGSVVQLSLALYDAEARIVCGPTPSTPIADLFQKLSYDPGILHGCAKACLAQSNARRPPVLSHERPGLAAVGVSLQLHGRVVGAVVAGYAPVPFYESVAVEGFAGEMGIPADDLWTVMRSQSPVRARRLVENGESLQVLADALLRESDRRRRSEHTARQFSTLASHDALTELPNRMMMADRLSRALASARRHQRPMAVLFLDLDGFKDINDSLGHRLGDELLCAVARELTACVRKADTVCRHGGDEFVVVLPELERAEDAAAVAQKIITVLAMPRRLQGQPLRITASVGISVLQDDVVDAETLLHRADLALYDAKAQGGGCHRHFRPELSGRATGRSSIHLTRRGARAWAPS